MRRKKNWHGCLSVAVPGLVLAHASAQEPAQIQSRVFEIAYRVNEEALPLESVQLWYTVDEGRTWHQYGLDEDRQSPMVFRAGFEGLYGFFLRLTNAAGASAPPPSASNPAHQWAFVDFTAPVVQLHPLRQTTVLAHQVLQIRWSAIDSNLLLRPIEIEYQLPPDQSWHAIVAEPLANTGRYDWRLPTGLAGALAIRVIATDKGSHRVRSDRQSVEIVSVTPSHVATTHAPVTAAPSMGQTRPTLALAGTTNDATHAARLLAEAITLRDAGDDRRAVMRLREAVKLAPELTDAFAEMGGIFYRMGDLDRALNAYEIALAQRPTMRNALLGAAVVDRQMHDYASAARRLRTILRYDPHDARTWMHLGDIAIYRGDEVLARECYVRATRIDPQAGKVIEDARKRLQLMTEVSRTFRSGGR